MHGICRCLLVGSSSSFLGNILSKMSTFVARISPVTGRQEWIVQDENYDYLQEIARSAYADMLHDTERNRKYYSALKEAIELMHKQGKPANVLDIGTGTGLLSMMAATCGADTVTACEAFKPMADCARLLIKKNGFADKILLVPKRSTELTVGPGGDLPARANILVTEVYDTELIGEGAIGTFHHAHQKLLQRDCIVVPSAANLYVQVVHSDIARRWNEFQPIELPGGDQLNPPAEVCSCPGTPTVHDLQLEQVPRDWFTPITPPVKVFRFDYSDRASCSKFSGYVKKDVEAEASGSCDAIFMWWDLEMDTKGATILSCAPGWAHPEPADMQWRDHWMQAVYYPKGKLTVEKGQAFALHSSHDDYALWFDVSKSENNVKTDAPVCVCGAHVAFSRTRIGMLNDPDRNRKYVAALEKVVTPDTVCLAISDGALMPLIVAKLGAKMVYTLEHNPASRRFLENWVESNGLKHKVKVINKRPEEVLSEDLEGEKANLVVGEPYFTSSMLPWHNFCFWYSRTELADLLAPQAAVLPWRAALKAVAVEFSDLWKIRAPVGQCEGFNLGLFDKMIQSATDRTDAYLEPQPLWEYPGVPLTDELDIINFDFSKPLAGIKVVEREGFVEIISSGTCNGVAVWIEYQMDKDVRLSSGLLEPPVAGQPLVWDPHSRQAVHILRTPIKVDVSNGNPKHWRLKHKLVFKPSTGELDINFSVLTTR